MKELCGIGNCGRALGHAGAHTAVPSARTADWDRMRGPRQTERIEAAVSLVLLDSYLTTPYWADLNDE